ncbi:response regulator receiver protein [Candidatus Magnetoovum chiemensis]|nr:response regulator receiver protein [Candidatus Magnetoovum chiemensis]
MINTILVVDDSITSRHFIKAFIQKHKTYQIIEADNGLKAVAMYKEHVPDLTFMDLTMPVMDGITAIKEIKKIDDKAVIIVITADIQSKTKEKVLNEGALMVLRKPPTNETIEDAIRAASQAKQKREAT